MQLLSIFHYVLGGLTGLVGCFPSLHVGIGIAIVAGLLDGNQQNAPPPAFGWLFIAVGSLLIVLCWSLAIAILVAGRKLASRRSYTFCLIVAGLECLIFPVGTALGAFTIIVLMRPSVQRLFDVTAEDETASAAS